MDLEIKTLIFGWGKRDYGNWSAMTASYFWRFKPKCWNERVQNSTVYAGSAGNNTYIERPWSSTRALTKYWVEFVWYTKGNEYLRFFEITSRKYGIKAGY
jgi:hypothetical protein